MVEGEGTSLMVEYAANKAGLGGVLGHINPQTAQKEPQNNPKVTQIKGIKDR